MGLSSTALTAVSTFTANVYPPQPGTGVLAADVAAGLQNLLNRTQYLYDLKRPGQDYDKSGTMNCAAPEADWAYDTTTPARIQVTEAPAGQNLIINCDLPNQSTWVSQTVFINPVVAVRAGLPSVMPEVAACKMAISTGVVTVLGTQVDTSADVTAYETYHPISILSINETVDRATYHYFLILQGEGDGGGGNFVAGLGYNASSDNRVIDFLDESAA